MVFLSWYNRILFSPSCPRKFKSSKYQISPANLIILSFLSQSYFPNAFLSSPPETDAHGFNPSANLTQNPRLLSKSKESEKSIQNAFLTLYGSRSDDIISKTSIESSVAFGATRKYYSRASRNGTCRNALPQNQVLEATTVLMSGSSISLLFALEVKLRPLLILSSSTNGQPRQRKRTVRDSKWISNPLRLDFSTISC